MSIRTLADAIRALVPVGITHHKGQAPTGAIPPWLVSNQSVPEVVSRSDASTPHARVGRVLLTVTGVTEDQTIVILDQVMPAFEGARVTAAGWLTSPLRQLGDVKIFPDFDVTLTGGTHPMVAKATFEYTVTKTD